MKISKIENRPHVPGGAVRNGRDKSSNSIGYYTGIGHSIPVYVNGKVIGEVIGETFQKCIKGSKHLLWRPPAIAFDIKTLKDAEGAGARRVEVMDIESGDIFWAPISTIWEKGVEFNRGYGWQIYLSLSHWLRPGDQATYQPSLFGSLSS